MATLPSDFEYFGFANFETLDTKTDFNDYYSEHNLRKRISNTSSDIFYQAVVWPGDFNDKHRIGVRLRLTDTKALKPLFRGIRGFISINPMLVEYGFRSKPNYLPQIEYAYYFQLLTNKLSDRLYLTGFMDQNLVSDNASISSVLVTEHQLGFRFYDQFYAVVEFRLNEYLSQPLGIAYGLEYKITF